jgi:hypothetical protein
MSGVLRNLITASMGRSGLGDGGVKSTMDFPPPRELLLLLGREEPRGRREVRRAQGGGSRAEPAASA